MSIKSWTTDNRPREKLLAKGATALSDAELLAIFLQVGVRGKSAVDLARLQLGEFGSLHGLFGAGLAACSKIQGMGPTKFVQLQAAMEMARRALAETMLVSDILSSLHAVRHNLRIQLQSLGHEVFVGIFLNARNQVIAADTL